MRFPPFRGELRLALSWPFVLVLLSACERGAPAPVARLRLWCDAPCELSEAPPPAAGRRVFAARFEAGLEGWRAVETPGREPGGLAAETVREEERALLRLEGAHGGLHLSLPVEPDTCYVFTGSVRQRALATDSPAFDGARFWLAEASAEASFEDFRGQSSALMTASWSSPSALGHEGWQEVRRVFVTTPRTHFLHVVCSLAANDSVRAGSVEFADLALEAHPLETFWQRMLARDIAERAAIDPPASGGLRARRVSAGLAGEYRPALVLLPGDRLRFALPPLARGARLTFGAGAWRATLLEGRGGRSLLRVRAQDELLATTLHEPLDKDETRWEPFELALADGARALEFTLEGDTPLVLGAPLVHTDARRAPVPDVLLISIDTLRADRVGAYGYAQATTPTLDRLARAGVLCRDASTVAPYTLPSHATLLTGQFPSVHGLVAHERTLAAARSTSLAEILGRAGYATQAFTAGGFVNAEFGLDRGFEGFAQIDPIRERESHYFRTLARKHGVERAGRLLDEHGFAGVERWLRARGAEPFFLFLHTYTVHDYDTPRHLLRCDELGCARPRVTLSTRTAEEAAAYTPEMRAHIQHLYDAALSYTDARLGQLLDLLRELGRYDNTLIVVTSDHGEEFFEHGALQHGRTLYQELLGIPLIFAGPGIEPRVLERPAMLVDVVPTLLARLGLPRQGHMQGVDLLGPEWPARALWSEVDSRFGHKYALRAEDGAKTIHGPPTRGIKFPNERAWEHFDLARDPGEQHDLADAPDAAHSAARLALERQRAALEQLGDSLGALGSGELGTGTLEELDGLGYGGE